METDPIAVGNEVVATYEGESAKGRITAVMDTRFVIESKAGHTFSFPKEAYVHRVDGGE